MWGLCRNDRAFLLFNFLYARVNIIMTKKILLGLLLAICVFPSVYGQKFTKKEKARREAREANYFYGASFTLTAGYDHSWMNLRSVYLDTEYYGKSEKWGNTHNFFNLGFLWDQAIDKKWGVQTGLYYKQKGADHLYYYDNGLGYGSILRDEETEEAGINMVELQSQIRRFFPVTYDSRFSVNGGIFIDKFFDTPSCVRNWNLGLQVGLGYDFQHISVSATYQCGLLPYVVDDCYSRLSSLQFNVGYRLWKK